MWLFVMKLSATPRKTREHQTPKQTLAQQLFFVGIVALPCGWLLCFLALALELGRSTLLAYFCLFIGLAFPPALMLLSVILALIPHITGTSSTVSASHRWWHIFILILVILGTVIVAYMAYVVWFEQLLPAHGVPYPGATVVDD